MTPIEKQAELKRHKSIIDASLHYLLLHNTGKYIFDDIDQDKRRYESQKKEAEKYFDRSSLEKLEKQLKGLKHEFLFMRNLDFGKFIKKTTGYEIDIYAEHRKGYEEVLAKGRIDTDIECHDFSIMISHEVTDLAELEEKYAPLLMDFHKRQMEIIEASPELKKKYDENHEIVEEDGELIEKFYSHGKPSHARERKEISPNGKRTIRISEHTHYEHSSTSIDLDVENCSWSLYGVDFICPDINAFWKDNQTIVIETKGYESYTKYRKIEIYGDIINIEYIES